MSPRRGEELVKRLPVDTRRPSTRTLPLPHAFAVVAVLATSLSSGCVGVGIVTGTAVDSAMKAASYPLYEYVCFGAYKYDNDDDAPWRQLEDDRSRAYGDELVGIAVSGGGSRAAYFLAAVLDEMRRVPAPGGAPGRTLLDEVDYISSVSGGSLSSAYYVWKRPRDSDPAALDAFFTQYREDMARDFETRSLGRMFLMFRWVPMFFTYYDRARLMAGVWDANFFDDATFSDLPPPGGPIPSLIINGASYSTGNKFVFSRIPAARMNESLVFRILSRLRRIQGGQADEHRPFLADGFDTIDSDIGRYKISLAVAASASVPGLLGPIYLKNRAREDAYEMVGDGGLYDNYGLETMAQLFATILEERPGRKARIIVVDGSGYFPARLTRDRYQAPDYVDRMSAIAWLRGNAHAELLHQIMPNTVIEAIPFRPHVGYVYVSRPQRARSPFRNLRIQVVSMYHELNEKELEDSKGASRVLLDFLTGRPITDALRDFNASVRGIGTRFKIDAEDAEILSLKAKRAVADVLGPKTRAPAAPVAPTASPPGR